MVTNSALTLPISLAPSTKNAGASVAEICFEGPSDVLKATEKLDRLCAEVSSMQEPSIAVVRLKTTGIVSPFNGDVSIKDVNRWERAVRRFERLDAVSIVLGSGVCGGIALDLMLAGDYRMAATDFHLFLPIHGGQFWPGMAMYRLAQQTGLAQTRRIVLRSSEIDNRSCMDLGLLDAVEADADTALGEFVHEVSSQPNAEYAIRRRLLLEAYSTTYEDALGTHLAACDRALRGAVVADHD